VIPENSSWVGMQNVEGLPQQKVKFCGMPTITDYPELYRPQTQHASIAMAKWIFCYVHDFLPEKSFSCTIGIKSPLWIHI
jgi:hypothetical protein